MIIIVGPKHSGKTTMGKELARLLELPFYDLDVLIEERSGQSVREIYTASPEHFQKEELSALKALLAKYAQTQIKQEEAGQAVCLNAVLATGGGIIDNPGAIALLQDTEHRIIYLEVPAETAWERIQQSGVLPPFLKANTIEESKKKHRILHERRAKAYKQIAHIVYAI